MSDLGAVKNKLGLYLGKSYAASADHPTSWTSEDIEEHLRRWSFQEQIPCPGTYIESSQDDRLPKRPPPGYEMAQLVATMGPSGWGFYLPELPRSKPIMPEFYLRLQRYQREQGRLDNHPLRKALGWTSGHALKVLDTTAGWGSESLEMALWGCEVTACEQNPLLAEILKQTWVQTQSLFPALSVPLNFAHQESRQLLRLTLESPDLNSWDVVYIDPMFPDAHDMSAPTKHMQALRKLHQIWPPSEDTAPLAAEVGARALWSEAMKFPGAQRIVVKRPLHAPPISQNGLKGDVLSKTARWDIYKPHGE